MNGLVEIAHFYDPEEAICARSFLRSHGVNAQLGNEHHLSTAPYMRVALGGYRLVAPEDSETEAADLLASIAGENAPDALASDLEKMKPRNWLWLPIAFAYGVPFLPKHKMGMNDLFQISALILLYATLVGGWLLWFR